MSAMIKVAPAAVCQAVVEQSMPPTGGRFVLGRRASLLVSAGVVSHTLWTSPENAKSAASVTMGAQAIGFVAALLLGGALTEYGPWPTRLCFWVLALFLIVLLIGTWLLPRHTPDGAGGDWRSRMPAVPKHVRRTFAVSSTAMVAAYTFGVLVLSLGGQVEHDLIGSPNAFLNGAVLSFFPIVMGAIGIIARTLSPRMALVIGALVSGLGMVLLILAVNFRDLVIYLLATAAAGGAYSLLFVGGLQVISAAAPERNRGGILAALYLLGYLSMGALALALGAIATARGLSLAVDLGAAAIIVMNFATLVLAGKTPSTISPS